MLSTHDRAISPLALPTTKPTLLRCQSSAKRDEWSFVSARVHEARTTLTPQRAIANPTRQSYQDPAQAIDDVVAQLLRELRCLMIQYRAVSSLCHYHPRSMVLVLTLAPLNLWSGKGRHHDSYNYAGLKSPCAGAIDCTGVMTAAHIRLVWQMNANTVLITHTSALPTS